MSFCKLHALLTGQNNIRQIVRYLLTASNTVQQLPTRGPRAVPFTTEYKGDEMGDDVIRCSSVMLVNSFESNKIEIIRR